MRAPAREIHESTAQSNPQSAVTESDENWSPAGWILDLITPPDIWNDGLRDDWEYARRGEWTSRTGVFRVAGQTYFIAVFFIIAALDYLKWIIKRPSRHAAAWVLLLVLAQFPPVSWLI